MAVRPIDGSELMIEIQACSWDSEQDKERAEDLVLEMPTLTPPNEWVSRVREIEELYTKLHTVTGFTAEQLLEMFAAGYTLEKADHSKDFEEMANLAEVTPPNEPLTIEQLREMDGEPVWVVYDQDAEKLPGFDPLALWALVEVTKGSVFLTNNLGGRTAYADDQDLEWAGITVYRRPPEGDEGKR